MEHRATVDFLRKHLIACQRGIDELSLAQRFGTLESAAGSVLTARLPGARLGERVWVEQPTGRSAADVIAFRPGLVVLLPSGNRNDWQPGQTVCADGRRFVLGWSEHLRGLVLDAEGRRMDGGRLPVPSRLLPVDAEAPDPLKRRPIEHILATGVRAIDGLATLGQGQRVGLFAGPGVGKSSLLGQIARQAKSDCIVVCMVGERGREVNEFLREHLGTEGLARSVVVCATSDAPAGQRARALPLATTVAEGFRSVGKSVLLLVDSLTRHARALREIALGAGEPPGRRGFPPSVFDRLANVVERTGNDENGSISAIYTVLTETDDQDDPVAEECRALLDGHIVLSNSLAGANCFPAVDPVRSLSRLMGRLVADRHLAAAGELRLLWNTHRDRQDLIAAGAYAAGSDALVDRAIALWPAMLRYLRQPKSESVSTGQAVEGLLDLLEQVPA